MCAPQRLLGVHQQGHVPLLMVIDQPGEIAAELGCGAQPAAIGRIADDHEHALASAISWYETYLSEAPHGHFATEAFGRRMVAISRQSGRAAARETAVEYLKRFPGGPHAAVARDLVSE